MYQQPPQVKKNFWDCYSFDKEPEYIYPQQKPTNPRNQLLMSGAPQQQFLPQPYYQPMQQQMPMQQMPMPMPMQQMSMPMQQVPMQQQGMIQPLQQSIHYSQHQPMMGSQMRMY